MRSEEPFNRSPEFFFTWLRPQQPITPRREPYDPPSGDHEPLDAIQEAIVRALVPVIAARIREQLHAQAQQRQDEQD